MDIKEVTHKIRYWLTFHTDDIDRDTMYEALEVMDTAIEEGEKYEEMWGWLDNMVNANGMEYNRAWKVQVGKLMYDLEQKYFSQPIKKVITIEVEAKDKNIIKWAEHQIKDLENNVWNHHIKINIITKGGKQC